MKKLIAFLLVLVVVFGAYNFVSSYVKGNLEAVDIEDEAKIAVEIPSGSSTANIADILHENNLIKDTKTFKYYAKYTKKDSQLKAGTYVLSKSMDVDELLNSLTKGGSSGNTANVTIIEGLTMEDAAISIAQQLNLSSDKLVELMNNASLYKNDYEFLRDNPEIQTLQGYLMPDTYNVYVNATEEDIVNILLTQFDEFYKKQIKPKMGNTKLNFQEVMTLSSIVEKEALLDEERDEVAKVFLNRLDINMKLQSCATVNYAHGEWKERLTYDDIAIDSPYNTYIIEGLPPGPINSPGKVSIIATLEPADVDYLYFVAKGDGSHYFSKTYDEHIHAAEEYLN